MERENVKRKEKKERKSSYEISLITFWVRKGFLENAMEKNPIKEAHLLSLFCVLL